MTFYVSNSCVGDRGQSGGAENRPVKTAQLHPCIWYRLLCYECGECYTAQSSPAATLKCPQCKRQISVQYLCKGLTVATLPHFSKLRGWTVDHASKARTLAEVKAFQQRSAEVDQARNLYYRVDYTIEKDLQYQNREVRVPHRG